MTVVSPDYVLKQNEFRDPVLWMDLHHEGEDLGIDTSDTVMDRYLGPGVDGAIKSFGHDDQTGVHFLLTRKGTAVHTDKAYLRYSHQIILRNDGNRIRGLPRFDNEKQWRPMMTPGVMYCLDTHSPHQGLPDPRFEHRTESRGMKAVLAVDRNVPLDPSDAYSLLRTYFNRQMSDFLFDPDAKFLKWKGPR